MFYYPNHRAPILMFLFLGILILPPLCSFIYEHYFFSERPVLKVYLDTPSHCTPRVELQVAANHEKILTFLLDNHIYCLYLNMTRFEQDAFVHRIKREYWPVICIGGADRPSD